MKVLTSLQITDSNAREVFSQGMSAFSSAVDAVKTILADVRTRGNSAVVQCT
jgi:histidinol dehydrogenase